MKDNFDHVAPPAESTDASLKNLATLTYRIESGSGYEAEATHKNITPKQYHQVVAALEGTLKEENVAHDDLVKALQEANFKLQAMQVDYTGPAAQSIYVLRERIDAALRKAGVK